MLSEHFPTLLATPAWHLPSWVWLWQGEKNYSPCLRAAFSRGLRGRMPMETLALFWLQVTSFSVEDPSTWSLRFTTPGGLWHPMLQQTWRESSCSSELLPLPSSVLSVLKHLLHVQFSTALNSGKSKPILTGTFQDTSLQWGLSICLTNSDLLPPTSLTLKMFFWRKKKREL